MPIITDAYVTVAEYKAAAGKISQADENIIRRNLVTVSRFIDDRTGASGTGYHLDPADSPTARVYIPEWDGNGQAPTVLDIQPLVSVTSVKIDTDGDGSFDEAAISSSWYRTLPLNAAMGPSPRPYRQLEVTPWGSQAYWPVGGMVQVTGRHGFPVEILARVWEATIELTKLLRLEGPRATNRMDDGGDVLFLSRDAQARNIINDLLMSLHPTGGIAVA